MESQDVGLLLMPCDSSRRWGVSCSDWVTRHHQGHATLWRCLRTRLHHDDSQRHCLTLTLLLVEAWQGCLDACRLVHDPNDTPARVSDCISFTSKE